MLSRERVARMLDFKSVDRPALEVDVNSVGIYEHGEKLRELFRTCEGDFGPINDNDYLAMPENKYVYDPDGRMWLPRPEEFDSKGEFHRFFTDAYGVQWEYRIFGVQGHPKKRPLDDLAAADSYRFPYPVTDDQFELMKADVAQKKAAGYFTKRGWVNIMERSYSLRRFEDVLMDIATRDEEFLRFTGRFHEFNLKLIDRLLATGCDAIQFADDFGTQDSLLISPASFREIYKPLYREYCERVHAAGRRCFYHCCGWADPLLEDFAELGFDTIWPQVNVYDLPEFAKKCRSLGLAVAIHPDRSELMTNGRPDDIKREIYRYMDIFRPGEGGSWIYLEMDNGFPWENVVAMVETVREIRG